MGEKNPGIPCGSLEHYHLHIKFSSSINEHSRATLSVFVYKWLISNPTTLNSIEVLTAPTMTEKNIFHKTVKHLSIEKYICTVER